MSNRRYTASAGGAVTDTLDLSEYVAEARGDLAEEIPDGLSGTFVVTVKVEETLSDGRTEEVRNE